jgi:hydrogenase nickel incorporation protein HypB
MPAEKDSRVSTCDLATSRQLALNSDRRIEYAGIRDLTNPENLKGIDFLFIDNAAGLAQAASCNLEEDLRLVLLAVTEGEELPLKYLEIFSQADVAIITKADLTDVVEFDWPTLHDNIQAVRPGMDVFIVSSSSLEGPRDFVDFLTAKKRELHSAVAFQHFG